MSGVEHAAEQIRKGRPADYDGYARARMRHERRDDNLETMIPDEDRIAAARKIMSATPRRQLPSELDDAQRAAQRVLRTSPKDRTVKRGY